MFQRYKGKYKYLVCISGFVCNRKEITGLSNKAYNDLVKEVKSLLLPDEYIRDKKKKKMGDRIWRVLLSQECAEAINFKVENSDCNIKAGEFEACFEDESKAKEVCEHYREVLKEEQEKNPALKLLHISQGKKAGYITV